MFPEIFKMDSLEKWRLDFSWRIINCNICQTEKDMSSETTVECCISAHYNLIAGMQWDVNLFTCVN